ncbi:hypothetical protein PAXINDRAFT_18658 [Paxillus involutus ATCC 200175]|uniref:Argonaute linker 1 domain-containing protein n=1 Tax=Paxillus involutus ATCC 200175 TaxID=664439 RepID=A0A0C9TLL6_PAXIN|nr:hypothetical protein PAXINDRAFT_18658 [Paxillus involutus ATCC 200175]
MPLSYTVQISLSGKRRIRDHLLGSYSGRIIDVLLDRDKPLTLQDDRHITCATITIGLFPVADYQQALNASVDATLSRLDNNQRLVQGVDNVDQAISSMQTVDYAVETCRQYIAPLGRALRLMIKLIDRVADAEKLSDKIREWLNELGTRLWISHGVGFGKTVLFSTSIEVIRKHTSAQGATYCCAYSYFDPRASGGVSRRFETLRSILDQLCFNIGSDEHPEPTLAQLRTTLGEVMKGAVCILINALDKRDSQVDLLDRMTSLPSSTQRLHLLATSRPERIIEERMSHSNHVRISLSSQPLDDDIKTPIHARVEHSKDLKSMITEMTKKLRARGDGVFRSVALWIDELKRCSSRKAITDTLKRLPTSLNDMYAFMVSKIDPNYLPYARAIMRWPLFSMPHLNLEEIATVVGFDFSDGRPAFDRDSCFAHPEAVLDVCGGLVVMSQGGVTLAHLTVKELLLEQKSVEHLQKIDAPDVFTTPAVYDGRKNMFTPRELPLGPDGSQESNVSLSDATTRGSPGENTGGQEPKVYKIRLTKVATINPEVLQRLIMGQQSHDDNVLAALTGVNVVTRTEPTVKNPFNVRLFFTDRETRDIGGCLVLWRGYSQSVRPAIGRLLVNVDISSAPRYARPGAYPTSALHFWNPDHDLESTKNSAVNSGALLLCTVPPSQIMRKQVPPKKTKVILESPPKASRPPPKH